MGNLKEVHIDCEMFDFSGVNEFDGESLVSHERESMDWPHNANANLDHKLTMAPQLILLAHIGTLLYATRGHPNPWGHHL